MILFFEKKNKLQYKKPRSI